MTVLATVIGDANTKARFLRVFGFLATLLFSNITVQPYEDFPGSAGGR